MIDDILHRERTKGEDTGVAIPAVVTAFDLSGDPMVSVRPMQARRVIGIDGEVEDLEWDDIEEVPYCYPSGLSFACFVPPEVGMEGFLVMTSTEVGEAASGKREIMRQKDQGSGFFIPSGNLSGNNFKGSADWAELRSSNCRVALSTDTVHLEAGDTSIIIEAGKFDVVVGGVSLVAALKQMSLHIRNLEALIHPGGLAHTGPQVRQVDTLIAASIPQRDEQGVR